MRVPLLNYGNHENIGTIIFLDYCDYSPSKCSVGYWRDTHPAHSVSLVYGVAVTYHRDKSSLGLMHGDLMQIKSPTQTRWYKHPAGNVAVDELVMPMQVVLDWDEFVQPMPRQLHWPDLKWFEPSYESSPRTENYTREELGEEIKRRLKELSHV